VNKKTILAGGLMLVIAIIIALKFTSNETPAPTGGDTNPSLDRAANRPKPTPAPLAVPAPGARPSGSLGATPALTGEAAEQARAVAIEKMQEASTSYDAAQLPVIQPYLVSPDPKLRAAAVDAMVVLGDASAGAMIREAAKSMTSLDEVKKMEKAADYVELPPVDFKKVSEKMKKRKAAKDAEKKAATEQP
jgi:hypothetical protein